MAENNSSAPLKTAEVTYPALPAGTYASAYSGEANVFSAEEMHAYAAQAVAAQATAAVDVPDEREAMTEARALLKKYLRLCEEIKRGDSHHLQRIDRAITALATTPATEDSSAGELAEATQDDEGISRGDWLAQAERLYLAVGDTLDEARMCASYLYNEQDWDGFGGDDPIHAALDDVEGRGSKAEVQAEPVMIYHGRCNIDCGEHGHQDVEMLKMIPAGAKLYTAPQAQPADAPNEWEEIGSLPTCDDLIWLYCQDTNTIDGPVAPHPMYEDSWTHWAYAQAPSTATIDAAMAAAQEGGKA